MDLPSILLIALIFTGVVSLIDIFWLSPKRAFKQKKPLLVDYSRSFFPVILIVFVIRSFIAQPWRVPTGSLEPTVLPGDYILVNQFAYGIRFPVLNKKIFSVGKPKIGDLVVFRWPKDPKINYVKRIIGTPGDHVVYQDKQLHINGQPVDQTILGQGFDVERPSAEHLIEKMEVLNGKGHKILIDPLQDAVDGFDIVVPEDQYFVMGDNRDASSDSRYWGFVPEEYLIGKPFAVLLSWDQNRHHLRTERFVKSLG